MKVKFILLWATFLIMCACTSGIPEQDIELVPGEPITITAYADGSATTKTGVVDNGSGGKSVVWKSGNSISLFFNEGENGGDKFTTATNGPVAKFTGSISAVSGDLSETGGTAYFWGLYPYNSTASCDGFAITTTLPSTQLAYQGDVADDLLVTVGRSENLAIYFKNTCAVIGFKLSQENITKVTFSGNNEEYVAGEFMASFDGSNNLTITPTANAVKAIEITPAESSTFAIGTTYYFAILPQNFESGYKLTFTRDDDYTATYERTAGFNFVISTFYTMTNKDSGLSFQSTQPNNVIYYTSTDGAAVTPYKANQFGSTLLTNVYDESGGVLTFNGDVTKIGEWAFYNCRTLSSITLPESISEMGEYAFNNCTSLSSIALPESISEIKRGVFSDCTSLASIDIPQSVTSIGESAFSGCEALSDIELHGETLQSIGNSAFYCTAISSFSIPESVVSIGYTAFAGCESLSEFSGKFAADNGRCLIVDNTIIAIAPYGLTEYTIPAGVTGIYSAFCMSTNLQSVIIPEGVTAIGFRSFMHCSSLTSITIPNSVTSIGDQAFDSSGLVSVTIPSSVNTIGFEAFCNCSHLASIIIENGVENIGGECFYYCTGLSDVTIPESVTSIGGQAFYNCTGLSSITVNAAAVPTIPSGAMNTFSNTNNCPIYVPASSLNAYKNDIMWSLYADRIHAIVSPSVQPNNEIWYTTSTEKALTLGPQTVDGLISNTYADGRGTMVFENDVTVIPSYLFEGPSVISVSLPSSVKIIENQAFRDVRITEIEIPKGCICEPGAFQLIPELERIIGDNASDDGRMLVQDGVLIRFANKGISSYEIPEGITAIGVGAFSGCLSLSEITLPSTIEELGGAAFIYCSITSLDLPNRISTIPSNCFNQMSAITSLTLPAQLERIENEAFTNVNLKNGTLTIPARVTYIGNGCVFAPSNRSIDVKVLAPTPPTLIGENAFGKYSIFEYYDYSYPIERGTTIYVPSSSVDIYRADPMWRMYFIDDIGNWPWGEEN